MALTNFGALGLQQKLTWARSTWKEAREKRFLSKFEGTGADAMIQRITELTKTSGGDKAVITLIPDLESDGVVGDNQLDGNEESIKAFDRTITIDQMRNANRHKGRMAEQRSVIRFRETSKDVLAAWLADRTDQLAMLTLSGIGYEFHTNGALRSADSQLSELEFAADVSAPTANRHFQWDATNGLSAGNTAAVAVADTPTYAMLVEMKAQARHTNMRPIRGKGGVEMYHVFMHPLAMAKLKLDSDYLANVRSAGVRGDSNPLFAGGIVTQDGLVIHDYRHCFNTTGATSGVNKWGAGSDVDGSRVLMCGAQSLAYADLGMPEWDEEGKDYGNQQGISIAKIQGMLKPSFPSQATGATEDFGVMCVDVAI